MADFTLKVSPDTLIRQADAIQKNVQLIRQHFDNINRRVNKSKNYWEGEASNLHVRTYSGINEQCGEIVKRLSEHPNDLLKMAGIYSENETKIVEESNSLQSNIFS